MWLLAEISHMLVPSPGFIALCLYKKLSIWFGEGVRFVDKKFLLLKISKFSRKKMS